MDARRWSNILSVERAFRAGESRPGGGPREAYIEVAARCNLRCIMCPITVDPRYQPGSGWPGLLEPEHFDRLEPVFSTLQRAHLFGLGEPLLNPHLFDYARRLSEAGVEVWTTTNATLIDDAEAEAMFEAGFDRVAVSIDGASRGTYEHIRKRGKWEDLMRGLEALGRVRQRRGRPHLVLSMVGMVSNFEEVPDLVDLAHEVGADEVFVEVIYDWPHPDLHEVYRREHVSRLGSERVRELVEAGRRRGEALGVRFTSRLDDWGGRLNEKPAGSEYDPDPLAVIGATPPPATEPPTPEVTSPADTDEAGDSKLVQIGRTPSEAEHEELPLPFPCSEPWQTINVSAAGEVRTCCFNNRIYGRLAENPIDEIWHGDAYTELRRLHVQRRSPPECDDCVKSWRVKRSPYLRPPEADPELPEGREPQAGEALPASPEPEQRLLAPGDGELSVGSELVVAGRFPRRSRLKSWLVKSWLGRGEPPVLPEIWLDGNLLARTRDIGVLDGERFALVIPVHFVSEGGHRLTLRAPEDQGGAVWDERQIQIGPLSADEAGALAAVSRLAFHVDLTGEERHPRLFVNGTEHALDSWICGTYGTAWRGVAVVDLDPLPPGAHVLELQLQQHPPHRIPFHRLALASDPTPAEVAAG